MVFSFLSPMVRKRLFSSEQNRKAKLEWHSKRIIERIERRLVNVSSSHFMPIKWALHAVQEARDRQEIDERLGNTLILEINALHAQCDRLINFKHEMFSWFLTLGAKTVVYAYFTVGAVSDC